MVSRRCSGDYPAAARLIFRGRHSITLPWDLSESCRDRRRRGGAPALTTTIPIVFTSAGDLVAVGLVASLPRPGSNLTGFAFSPVDLDPKRLELISELVPKAGLSACSDAPQERDRWFESGSLKR